MDYREFFEQVTGKPPFPYQQRLGQSSWPDTIDVPTGLGKTAAVVVAWMWKRLSSDPGTGRRLVYCLPMRALVDQTQAAASGWRERAASVFAARDCATPTVHVLMGGDADESWALEPESAAIIVGTQDMLLSRALCRGYGMSRYKWPVHFAFLNNDCLWVYDETQLLGVGIETGAQLQAFRGKLGASGPACSIWMSATLGRGQLDTVDHPEPEEGFSTHKINSADLDNPIVLKRAEAKKSITREDATTFDSKTYAKDLAARVVAEHGQRGGLTLVIANRVVRAQEIYRALEKSAEGKAKIGLIHSRFRRGDRDRQEGVLVADGDRIVVATQAIEAGIDVSARTMFTELAPWPSLVQRFGRCNRYGESQDARIFWIDADLGDKDDLARPYDLEELKRARAHLDELGTDAGPRAVGAIKYKPPLVVRPVLRRRDLLDLFDTTPDLLGNDLDVSRFVRDGDDTDVQVYWREFADRRPPQDLAAPDRGELCRVSVAAANDFLAKLHKVRKKLESGGERDKQRSRTRSAWGWDPLERRWKAARSVRPGQIVLLHVEAGGYHQALGWLGGDAVGKTVPAVYQQEDHASEQAIDDEAMDADVRSSIGRWVRLADHLGHVRDESRKLARALTVSDHFEPALATAGAWHDVGKSHPVFQAKLVEPVKSDPALAPPSAGVWAKSSHRRRHKSDRPHFRHELASALAWLAASDASDKQFQSLVAYLVAAHHGKVRLSIRSLPGEKPPPGQPDRLMARGVLDGEVLPEVELCDGEILPPTPLDLSVMQIGSGSWLERMLALRDAPEIGPFRLAFLESIVRVADWRASAKEQKGAYRE